MAGVIAVLNADFNIIDAYQRRGNEVRSFMKIIYLIIKVLSLKYLLKNLTAAQSSGKWAFPRE